MKIDQIALKNCQSESSFKIFPALNEPLQKFQGFKKLSKWRIWPNLVTLDPRNTIKGTKRNRTKVSNQHSTYKKLGRFSVTNVLPHIQHHLGSKYRIFCQNLNPGIVRKLRRSF